VEEEYRSLCAPRPPSPRVRGSLPRTAGLPCGSGAVGRGCLQNTSSLTSWRPNPGAGPGGWGRGLRPLPRCRPPGSCGSPELSALRSQPDSLWSPRPLAPLPASSPGPSPRGSEQVGVAMAFASWWYKTVIRRGGAWAGLGRECVCFALLSVRRNTAGGLVGQGWGAVRPPR
jgi:hypothetical protein